MVVSGASGITLTEILICLSLIGVLAIGVSPGLDQWQDKQAVIAMEERYRSAINLARSTAVTRGVTVTFCRSLTGDQCNGSWTAGSILFTDHNRNRQVDGQDERLLHIMPNAQLASITFRSFGNKQYLQITPEGFTDYQNGNFTFCPLNGRLEHARQLVISTTARTRQARDTDNDGIQEDSRGRDLRC